MNQASKDRYNKLGCLELVREVERKDSVIDQCERAINVVLELSKKGDQIPTAHIQSLEEASIACTIERGV